MDTIDPYKFPLNPLAGRHPLLQSLDPLRSLQALLSGHRYDIVISGNDGPAVLLALLRRLFRLKASVSSWDLSPAVVWRRRAWLQDVILPKVDGILALPAMQEAYARERWGVRTWQPASSSIPISISRKRGIPVTIYFPSATTLDAITRLCLPPPDALDVALRIRTSKRLTPGTCEPGEDRASLGADARHGVADPLCKLRFCCGAACRTSQECLRRQHRPRSGSDGEG